MKTIYFASQNKGKIKEVASLLAPLNIQLTTHADCPLPDVVESACTFVENALLKARAGAKVSKLPTLAEDAGLVVPSLRGEPGVYSARYAGEPSNDANNNQKLLEALADNTDRQAYYISLMVLVMHPEDPAPLIAEGRWHGEIAHQPKGEKGFGYDPLFCIPALNQHAAELSLTEKNKLSHRGQALTQLLATINL